MKVCNWLIPLLLICSLFTPVEAQRSITLQESYEWARENYPLIRKYGLIDQTEQYNLSNAGKGWLPNIAVNGKATYQSEVTQLPFDSEAISSLIPGFNIPTLSKDQYQLLAELNQPIWDGGNIRAAKNLTKAQALVDRQQLESDLYTLNERVNNLYFGALLQEELLEQNATLQQDLQVNIERIRAMITNGVANQSDLENMEVEYLNAQQQEIELTAARRAYLYMLGLLTGKELNEQTKLQTPRIPGDRTSSIVSRPELRTLTAQEELAELQNERITAGLMPQIGLFVQGGYGRPGLNFLEDRFKAFYVAGVRLSWNIGNIYTLKNDRRLVTTNRQSIHIQRDVFLFNIHLQMIQQNSDIQKIADLMKADQEIIRLRTNIKQAAEVKLENGIISVTDFIREIHNEDMARQNAAVHNVQYLMSIYNYMYTTGNS